MKSDGRPDTRQCAVFIGGIVKPSKDNARALDSQLCSVVEKSYLQDKERAT